MGVGWGWGYLFIGIKIRYLFPKVSSSTVAANVKTAELSI
jgi:hypothetical protein